MACWLAYRATLEGATMDFYMLVKTLHIVSATIVFGTGIGIANSCSSVIEAAWLKSVCSPLE
jgi:hypothetical protein